MKVLGLMLQVIGMSEEALAVDAGRPVSMVARPRSLGTPFGRKCGRAEQAQEVIDSN